MSRIPGGGNRGAILEPFFYPDATFISEIQSLQSNGSPVIGKHIQIVSTGNYKCTSPAANANSDGQITNIVHDSFNTFKLTCDVWGFTGASGNLSAANRIRNFKHGATPTLGQHVKISGGTYHDVLGTDTAGIGKIVSISGGYCDVLLP